MKITPILCKSIRLQYNGNREPEIVLTTKGDIRQKINELSQIVANGKELVAEIQQYRAKRSLDANGYMWKLCDEIAKVIRGTKEEVYRKTVREVGVWVPDMTTEISVDHEAVKTFVDNWSKKGLGWHAEIIDSFHGEVTVIVYYGSSTYDTKQMARLIDCIVDEAKNLGIETMTPKELSALKEKWRG